MISVCMATYNGEKFIAEQLESILGQISKDDEIIISDDQSSDATIDIIKKFNDSRIQIFSNRDTHGFTPNFQNALIRARGDIIFLSDQDDVWLPNKVEKTLQQLENCDLAISDCVVVDVNRVRICESRFAELNVRGTKIEHLIKSKYLGCCMAFSSQLIPYILPFPNRYDLIEHDIWIAAVGFTFFKVGLICEPLIEYRRHGNNVSDGGFGKGYSLPKKIEKRVYRLYELAKLAARIPIAAKQAKINGED